MKRTYTDAGRDFTADEKRSIIDAEIECLEWQTCAPGLKLPLMQGLGIQGAINELRIPNIERIAWNGVIDGRYGLYGIEARYDNGLARIYVLDRGSDLVILCSEIEEENKAAA